MNSAMIFVLRRSCRKPEVALHSEAINRACKRAIGFRSTLAYNVWKSIGEITLNTFLYSLYRKERVNI